MPLSVVIAAFTLPVTIVSVTAFVLSVPVAAVLEAVVVEAVVVELAGALGELVSAVEAGVAGAGVFVTTVVLLAGVALVWVPGRSQAASARAARTAVVRTVCDFMENLLFQCIR